MYKSESSFLPKQISTDLHSSTQTFSLEVAYPTKDFDLPSTVHLVFWILKSFDVDLYKAMAVQRGP